MDDQVDRLRLVILVGAAREDRFGLATAEWLGARARLRQDFEVDVIDLATAWLPDLMAADPTAPLPSAVRDLCPWLAGADAFAVVTQEYRFGCYGGAREVRGVVRLAAAGPAQRTGPPGEPVEHGDGVLPTVLGVEELCTWTASFPPCSPAPDRTAGQPPGASSEGGVQRRGGPAKGGSSEGGGPARDAGHPLVSRPLRVR
ncbi:NAD(P)H-dependent oxidoreductase [Streptomyces sp. NBC_01259]|uniref:NADPH-dependent FMN reductase n=1 Tax=Streptomyces sp. NBC_01259 TaxID=2903800 RepID=UPI00324E4914